MTTTADKIRALPDYDTGLLNDFGGGNVEWWQTYLRDEIGRANDHWREAAAALVEAEPQAVRVKPDWDYFQGLVNIARRSAEKAKIKFPQPNYVTLKIAEEAGEVVRGAVHYAEGRMEWDEVQGEIVQLLAMLIRFVTEGDEVNGIKPPDLVPLTPPPVDASPALDPVSKTPTLDAMAMQRAWYTAGIRAAALRYRAGSGPDSWDYFALAEAAILDLLTFERVDPPLPSPAAALAEAKRLPEVKALVEAAYATLDAIDKYNAKNGTHIIGGPPMRLAKALAALKGVK